VVGVLSGDFVEAVYRKNQEMAKLFVTGNIH